MLNIKSHEDGTVYLSGRLDASQSEKADQVFETFTETITVDLSKLEYISSAGLSVLLRTYKRLHSNGHELKLRGLNDRVRNVFFYAGLDKVFTIE